MAAPRQRSTCLALTLLALILGRPAVAQLDAAAAASARSAGAENPPIAPDPASDLDRISLAGRVVSLQIVGRIGVDVVASGFEALAAQREIFRGARAVVVEIDSDSGSDAAALRMAEALGTIGVEAPVIMVVRRAIGPAFLLLPVADRILVPEPAPPEVLFALQPECDHTLPADLQAAIDRFAGAAEVLLEASPRRDFWSSILNDPRAWRLTARDAYAIGMADPLDGGTAALARVLRIEPWVPAGKQLDELIRRFAAYDQQLQLFRSRLIARAFATLASVNDLAGQMSLAEQTASGLDPRRLSGGPRLRLQPARGGWSFTPASRAAWNRACDAAISAWERAASIGDTAARQLRSVRVDIGMLVDTALLEPGDPLLPEAIDRLEEERVALETRVAALRHRSEAARQQAEEIRALRR